MVTRIRWRAMTLDPYTTQPGNSRTIELTTRMGQRIMVPVHLIGPAVEDN